MILQDSQIQAMRGMMSFALGSGASDVALIASSSTLNTVATLDGAVDKVTGSSDLSIVLRLFVDGRYGSCSINTLEGTGPRILRAIDAVRMMTPDPLRRLPDPSNWCREALTGREMDCCDEASYALITPEKRISMALDGVIYGKAELPEGMRMLSEECEYSDSLEDCIIMDSNGVFCRHTSTSFEYSSFITVCDKDGQKYSSSFWDADTHLAGLDRDCCGKEALERAIAQRGSHKHRSGRYAMVVERDAVPTLVTPLLDALAGYGIDQGASFLKGTKGRKVLSEGLTIVEDCHLRGQDGSCLFDTEGVRMQDGPIIENGIPGRYFLSTYFAARLGEAPTYSNPSRVHLMPCGDACDAAEIMRRCSRGIYVTGFNGGNTNPVTGDFSFGVEGFWFENGAKVHPIEEMLVTGNMIDLWKSLRYAGSDINPHMEMLVPTVAFDKIYFNS